MFLFVSRRASGVLSQQFYSRLFSQPTHYLTAIAVLSVLNFVNQVSYNDQTIAFGGNLWNPAWLLMGPLLLMFRYNRELREKNLIVIFFHFIPFFALLVISLLTNFHLLIATDGTDSFRDFYQKSFILVPVSLIVYSITTSFPLRKKVTELAPFDDLQLIISGFYILIAAVAMLMHVCWGVIKVDMVIDYRIIIYALLSTMVAVICYYITTMNSLPEPQVVEANEDENNIILSLAQINEYEQKLQHYLVGEQTFLNPNLSLSTLSQKLQIPKYHLSVLFNHHLGKSFYSYLATLRINYALVELENGNNYTVESLAYKCGFNSRTSFHKYFREYTGLTPIAYINKKSKSE